MSNNTSTPTPQSGYAACIMDRERYREELQELTVQFGFALESIRELVQLAKTAGHEKATAVKVAQRFLAEMEGGK